MISVAKYYGIIRSNDYLAHYGIRGMKWGIRKAIERNGGNHLRSKAYVSAQKKLKLATAGGGIIGGAIYAHRHKDELNKSFAKSQTKRNTPGRHISTANKNNVSSRDAAALKSFKRSTSKGAITGALTVGGGLGGGAVGALKYARSNPNEYKRVKKAFKNMSFKQRMKYVYGRG